MWGGPKALRSPNFDNIKLSTIATSKHKKTAADLNRGLRRFRLKRRLIPLLNALNNYNKEAGIVINKNCWPKSDSWLSRELNTLKVSFEGVGIKINFQRTGIVRRIIIERILNNMPVSASQEPEDVKPMAAAMSEGNREGNEIKIELNSASLPSAKSEEPVNWAGPLDSVQNEVNEDIGDNDDANDGNKL